MRAPNKAVERTVDLVARDVAESVRMTEETML
jgi:hypothetical protein